jgi:hypothetical protein
MSAATWGGRSRVREGESAPSRADSICRTNAGGDAPPAPAEDATAGINLGSSPQLNSKPMPATEGIVRVERSPVTSGAAREGFCANSPRSLSSVSTGREKIINDVPFGLLNFSG